MTFADSALSLIADASSARRDAWRAFTTLGLPTTSDEVWRYAPLSDLDLDHYALARPADAVETSRLARSLARHAGLVVTMIDGVLIGGSLLIMGLNFALLIGLMVAVLLWRPRGLYPVSER